jgi:hypothetical protein
VLVAPLGAVLGWVARTALLPSHTLVKTCEDCEIYLRKPGFEFTPVSLRKIASFIVRRHDGAIAVFAFSYSMLDFLDDDGGGEPALLDSAVRVIEDVIHERRLEGERDYTYESKSGSFSAVTNPAWWLTAFG